MKKIIAREGLIILGFIGLFLLSNLSNNFAFLMTFSVLGYPLYLVIRFVAWAIKTLRPGMMEQHKNVDWNAIKRFADNHEYLKMLELMEEIEKNHPELNIDNNWIATKRVAIKGGFIEKIYSPCQKLIGENKFEEAKKLSQEGLDVINKNLVFFMHGDKSFDKFQEEMKQFEDEKGELDYSFLAALLSNEDRNRIRQELAKFEDGMGLMYFDLFVTPIFCDMAIKNQKNEIAKTSEEENNKKKL